MQKILSLDLKIKNKIMNKNNVDFNSFKARQKTELEFVTKYIKPHLFKIEIILGIFISAGYLFNIKEILLGSLFFLSFVYFFMGFAKFENDNIKNKKLFDFFKSLIPWGRSVMIVGILFVQTNWPGAELQLRIGGIIVFACLLVILYHLFLNQKSELYSITEFFRSLIIFTIGAFFYFFEVFV